jgi:uncharacterized protein (TIGR02001 family)
MLVAFAYLPPGGVRADDSWSATAGGTTDYVFRGVSQTYGGAAGQLGLSYQSAQGWFAGAWGSNVDPYPAGASSTELDLYVGVSEPLCADLALRATVTRYTYLHDPRPTRYDYSELAVTLAYLDRLALTVSYLPDSTSYSNIGFARDKPAAGYELAAGWPAWWRLEVVGSAGYYDLHRLFGVGYWAGKAGLAYVDRRLTVELDRFVGDKVLTTLYGDASADGTWALSVVLRF